MNKFLIRAGGAWLALVSAHAFAAQLLESGSFEYPRVKARTPLAQGGTPMLGPKSDWVLFVHPKADAEKGAVIGGITNELARTGKQSLFIEFDKFKAKVSGVTLASGLISIQPGKPYHVAIWGRLNKKKPLTIDQRICYLKLLVEFYTADKETQTGSPVFKAQPMPDSRNRPETRPPMFSAARWSEFFVNVNSPEDAAFIKITWKWESTTEDGETTGVIYFDDASLEGEKGPEPPEPEEEPTDEEMEEEKPSTPPNAQAKPATPVATPAPARKQ